MNYYLEYKCATIGITDAKSRKEAMKNFRAAQSAECTETVIDSATTWVSKNDPKTIFCQDPKTFELGDMKLAASMMIIIQKLWHLPGED